MTSLNPSRREEICRLAGQISCQSLQLRDIVDNIYQRGQSPAKRPSSAPSSPPGFMVRKSVSGGKSGGGRRASASPKMCEGFNMNAKLTTDGSARKGSTGQFLTVQVPLSIASQFMATQNLYDGELSVRQSMSSFDSGEDPKTSQVSWRPKLLPSLEPPHPRPYDDDSSMEVWESNMQRLTQLLKMLLQEMRSVSGNTNINEPMGMVGAGAVMSGVPLAGAPVGPVREPADLSVYFNRLASQMEALTQALKPNSIPPRAGSPMANRPGSPAGQQMDNGEVVSLVNRANVSFQRGRSSPIPPTPRPPPSAATSGGKGARGLVESPTLAALVASVNQFTNHMTKVQELFRLAIGAIPVPKKKERLTIAEEEALRNCVSRLSDNMAKVASDLKTTLDQHTPAREDLEEDTEDW
ncbi:hypothetical protein HPB51_022118 [Rhipicephalus microplus]|uniref:Uncharacterized protein n=1 Tax=Rhipicephalus microplus TaxID=6941 RepID=A0A9J6ECY3_RHIMP|nr:hypothetical protein HPB51_022118 [Rhipicephalus microplus]